MADISAVGVMPMDMNSIGGGNDAVDTFDSILNTFNSAPGTDTSTQANPLPGNTTVIDPTGGPDPIPQTEQPGDIGTPEALDHIVGLNERFAMLFTGLSAFSNIPNSLRQMMQMQ